MKWAYISIVAVLTVANLLYAVMVFKTSQDIADLAAESHEQVRAFVEFRASAD